MAVQSLWTAIPNLRMCIPNLQTEKLNAVHRHMQHAAFIIATRCVFGAKTVPFSEGTTLSGFRGHSKRDSNPTLPPFQSSSEG